MSDGWIKREEFIRSGYPNGHYWAFPDFGGLVYPSDKWLPDSLATHFQIMKPPTPPPPEKPPEQIAYEKWLLSDDYNPFMALRPCWLAALEFAKQNKGEL